MKSVIFRSRVSAVLLLFFVVVMVLTLLPALEDGAPMWLVIFIALLPFCMLYGIYVSTKYIINEDRLTVKCIGITMLDVDIVQIHTVKRSYNPLSSPALSLRRLSLTFYLNGVNQSILISPVREHEFIEQLKAVNPKITTHINDNKGTLRFWDWDI